MCRTSARRELLPTSARASRARVPSLVSAQSQWARKCPPCASFGLWSRKKLTFRQQRSQQQVARTSHQRALAACHLQVTRVGDALTQSPLLLSILPAGAARSNSDQSPTLKPSTSLTTKCIKLRAAADNRVHMNR